MGNTAYGNRALFSNTHGNGNVAVGASALENNTTGSYNVANGGGALQANTTGTDNVAIGVGALEHHTTGVLNIALGTGAGRLLTNGSNNIDIDNQGVAGESKTIRIGTDQTKTFIAGINGAGVTGTAVQVSATGQLGTPPSAARFKQNIQTMDEASDSILALRPVTFRYQSEIDPDGLPQFGLIAEEVERVNPALVVCDKQGKPYTVRYEAVNAMLLNEFLKEHRKVENLEATALEQREAIAALTATLKEQAAEIKKVSAQIDVKAAPQRVAKNR
jgi:hypothetical protein